MGIHIKIFGHFLDISPEIKKFRYLPIPYTGITHYIYIQKLVVRARQLDSVAQLVRALH
jgi:hypothetical protein